MRETDPPFKDRIWIEGFYDLTYRAPGSLLIPLVHVLKQVAVSSPDLFRSALDRLRTSECCTAHAVLLRVLAIEGGTWKAFAINYLEETWNRWGLWYRYQELWDCRCLLQALTPTLKRAMWHDWSPGF